MTGTLPNRSVRRPENGDSANIPNVWPLMTSPTASRSWPWAVMWSGVIVMIRTMTTWPVTRATIATGTLGRRRTPRSDDRGAPVALDRSCRDDVVGELVRVRPEERRTTGSPPPRRTRSARGTRRRAPAGRATGDVAGRAARFGPDDRADRRAPDDGPDRRRPPVVRVHVGRRRSATAGSSVAETDEQRADQEQRERAGDDRDGRDERAERRRSRSRGPGRPAGRVGP